MIEYREYISRQMVQGERGTLFVFGDNLQKRGFGGQAREIRGEINAVGIPTKRHPSMVEGAFFDNSVECLEMWAHSAASAISGLLIFDGVIVWPEGGIGTGRAQLKERAPRIWRAIDRLRVGLELGGKDNG